jgi:hypothetical protein
MTEVSMKRMWFVLLLGAAPLISPEITFSHHGTNISYEQTKPPLNVTGTVKEFRWANPHVFIILDAPGGQWSVEGDSPYNHMRRGGWNRNTLKVGQQITVTLYPSKVAGARAGVLAKVILPDGKEALRFRPDEPDQPTR